MFTTRRVPAWEILWQLLRARLLPGRLRPDDVVAAAGPHVADGCPAVSSPPLSQISAAVSDVSYSASFASHSANGLLLFLLSVIVFYTGEAMHRDREMKVEPVLWSVPAPNNVLLLSKFLSTLLLVLFLLVLVGLTAMLTQLLRGHTPVEISTYLVTYSVILVPSLAFMAAASIALNVLLRDKYLAYAVSIATGSGLFYLYSQGYNHWLYNPVLYGLWTEGDLVGTGSGFSRLLSLRV